MKKIIVILIVLIASPALAAPFLTCDPDTNCQYYKIYADDQLIADNVPAPLWYDLQTMPIAGVAYDAECCNYRGCERTVDPFVSLDDGSPPMNLRLENSQSQ